MHLVSPANQGRPTYSAACLADEVGHMRVNHTLHLRLDLLGHHIPGQFFEERLVLAPQLVGAEDGLDRATNMNSTYNDRSHSVIRSTGTLSSIPFTPA